MRLVNLDAVIDCLELEWGYEGMREDLHSLPVVDAMPVVRCKDCANFRQNVHGVCWCDEYGGAITPEDYCSRAVTDKPSRVKIPWEAD